MTLSTQQLEELLELEKKATPGPWIIPSLKFFIYRRNSEGEWIDDSENKHGNLDFLEASRNSIRSIIEELLLRRELYAAQVSHAKLISGESYSNIYKIEQRLNALTQPQEKNENTERK